MKRKKALADSPFFPLSTREVSERQSGVFTHDNFNASPQSQQQPGEIASKQTSLLASMQAIGLLKATHTATFRFPPELLEKLDDIEYRLRKNHKIKTTKNAILVGALALILYEFDDQLLESHLYQYLAHLNRS